MLFKYIAKLYLKHLFFILLALVSFFVFFDYALNVKNLPEASNLQLLYVTYKAMEALDVLWQLSAIFAFITSWIAMVRTNALVSFYSFGYAKRAVVTPFVVIFFGLYLMMLGLQTTNFSYAKDKAKQIKSYGAVVSISAHLFFKYQNEYVFFEWLYPVQQKAENIRIISLQNNNIAVIDAQEGFYQDNRWLLPKANITYVKDGKVINEELTQYYSLDGFKPKVLESVYEVGSNFSLEDAFSALLLLQDQGVKTNKIRAILYNKFLFPISAVLLIIIFFIQLPPHIRFVKISLVSVVCIVSTLVLWGVSHAIFRLMSNNVLLAEAGLLIPFILTLYIIKKIFFEKNLTKSTTN